MASIQKHRRKDGGVTWEVEVRVRGFPARRKSFRTRHEADAWSARIEAAAHGRTLVVGAQVTVNLLIDECESRLKSPLDAALKYWRKEIGTLRLRDVTPHLIATHRDQLLGAQTKSQGHKSTKARTPATVRHYLSTLGAVFKIGVRELRWCDTNPLRDVTSPSPAPGRTRFLSDAERTVLLDSCKSSDSPTLYAYVLMALTTGARRGEISGLRWADVDLKRRWAIFPLTKNGESRGVPLVAAVVAELEKLGRDGDRVFEWDMTRAWRTALRRAELTGFRFHDLRHSAASMLVQSGANLSEVAQLLGHKDIRMTQRYSHIHSAHTLALVDRVMRGIA